VSQIVTPSNAGFSPREIRRQDFQEAVAVTLDRQAHAITATREFMADLSVRLDDLHAQVTAAKADLVALAKDHAIEKHFASVVQAQHNELRKRSFLGRLRWLLTGK
jgi:hypothetical protein